MAGIQNMSSGVSWVCDALDTSFSVWFWNWAIWLYGWVLFVGKLLFHDVNFSLSCAVLMADCIVSNVFIPFNLFTLCFGFFLMEDIWSRFWDGSVHCRGVMCLLS